MTSNADSVLSIADYDTYKQLKHPWQKKCINKLCGRVLKATSCTYRQKLIDNCEEEVKCLQDQLNVQYDMISDLAHYEGRDFKKRTLKDIHKILHDKEDSDSE